MRHALGQAGISTRRFVISIRLPLLLIDILCVLTPIMTALSLYAPVFLRSDSQSIYISRQGSDWNGGRSEATAFATIQYALDRAQPGDRIFIAPGTYYERLHLRRGGTEKLPVSIKAITPGSVVITGERPENIPRGWAWREEGEGIFSTAIDQPVYRLNHSDFTCFRLPWGGSTALRKMVAKPGAWSAFCEENGRLYLYLKEGKHPATEELRTHRPAPAPREWGEFKSATVWIEADHVRLEGLHMDFGIGAAVHIGDADDVEIRDCVLTGSTFGVKSSGGEKPARRISIENCLYHNYPQYHWLKDWLSWDEVYSAYPSSSLASSVDAPLQVRNCLVTHAGDALQISPRANQDRMPTTMEGNWLAFCTDDAIEFDGDGCRIDVRNNLIYEAHQNLGFSPVTVGPIQVHNNLFAHARAGINGSQIKLINNRPSDRTQNISVRENVFVGDWLCWYNDSFFSNVVIDSNQFYVRREASPPWPKTGVEVGEHQVVIQSEPQRPEDTLAAWYHRENQPDWVHTVLDRRPGPAWFRAEDHPATKDLIFWKNRLQQLLLTVEPR